MFPHGTSHYRLYISYLALEEGSPLFKQVCTPFYLLNLGFSTFIHTTGRISFDFIFPEVNKMFQFTPFIN